MDVLRVAPGDLLATANGWHGLGADLASTAAPAGLGLSFQASAAAVDAVHAGTDAAGVALAARTQITAVKTAAAAATFASQEVTSADVLKAVGESL
jgi:hypothetical protein